MHVSRVNYKFHNLTKRHGHLTCRPIHLECGKHVRNDPDFIC